MHAGKSNTGNKLRCRVFGTEHSQQRRKSYPSALCNILMFVPRFAVLSQRTGGGSDRPVGSTMQTALLQQSFTKSLSRPSVQRHQRQRQLRLTHVQSQSGELTSTTARPLLLRTSCCVAVFKILISLPCNLCRPLRALQRRSCAGEEVGG